MGDTSKQFNYLHLKQIAVVLVSAQNISAVTLLPELVSTDTAHFHLAAAM
jgi:hypothetical protein